VYWVSFFNLVYRFIHLFAPLKHRPELKFGLKAKVRFNELADLAVLFRELLLLAPNSFEGGA
jgi:hypothetical protein